MAAETIKKGKESNKKPRLDISKALALKTENGLSYQQIADVTGVPKSTIHAALQDLLPSEDTKTFQDNRAAILSNLQIKLIQQLDDERLKKMPAASAILAMCQLYDKERLEVGKTTSNIAQVIFQMPAPKPVPDHLKMIIEEKNSEDNNEGGVSC